MIYDIPKDKNNENRVVNVEDVQESNFGYIEDNHDNRSNENYNDNNFSK